MSQSSEPKLVAIAGATGNAGKELVRAAKKRGLRVRVLVRSEKKLAPIRDCCDEIKIVQVTQPETLLGALDGADYLVSAVGKTFQNDKISRKAVDLDANVHLFQEAKKAGVQRVGFISVFTASVDHPSYMIRLKGEAEKTLKSIGVPYVIVQPSGFFSDMWEVFEMCQKGTYWSIGDGKILFNPISLLDLGAFTIDALLDDTKENQTFPVGGPDVFEMRELANIAGRVLERKVKIRTLPLWLCRLGVALVKPFNKNAGELGEFFVGNIVYAEQNGKDMSIPKTGTHHLEDYFRERYLAEQK
mgnify:CR=1 FL=1